MHKKKAFRLFPISGSKVVEQFSRLIRILFAIHLHYVEILSPILFVFVSSYLKMIEDQAPPHPSQQLLEQGAPKSNKDTCGRQNIRVESPAVSDIAVCGIGLRLPGGIHNCEDYWNLLYNGLDARGPVPSSRYNNGGFDDSLGGINAIKFKHGYFLDEDLSCLDTSFFTMAKGEVDKVDPQQRLLLEVTRECLEDAGEVDYRGKQIGCYVGTFGDDWLITRMKDPLDGGLHAVTGYCDLMMANRISFENDFRGPR